MAVSPGAERQALCAFPASTARHGHETILAGGDPLREVPRLERDGVTGCLLATAFRAAHGFVVVRRMLSVEQARRRSRIDRGQAVPEAGWLADRRRDGSGDDDDGRDVW